MNPLEERMGPRWSSEELHLFFEGLRKHDKNWSQISLAFQKSQNPSIHPRTESMIESVYLKNKTYLSIPTSNPTDFAAIMADHYDSIESSKLAEEPKEKQENFEIPKKRSTTSEPKTSLKKPFNKKPDFFDISSKPAEISNVVLKRLQDSASTRSFPNFSHSPSCFLQDYATCKVDEVPISAKFLQWCKAEWFYSYVDRGFFAYSEFEESLKVLKLAEVNLLQKYEFEMIRNALPRPRRFSPGFVLQERKKLAKYREAVKVLQQGKVLPPVYHDMIPYINLSHSGSNSRLMVGQKVIAVHPLTREVRSGLVLTLDSSRYHIQFDRPELGVFLVSDQSIQPCMSEASKAEVEDSSPFVYKPVQEREVISPNFVIEGFKAGVNIYAMAFLLKLLERKEALIELLKQFNHDFASKVAENKNWKPDHEMQQQYAWICVTVQAINTSISKVLEIFRLRNRPPPQPAVRVEIDHKIEQIKDAASNIVNEELDQRTSQFADNEFVKIQENLKNGVVLLGVVDLIVKENDPTLIKYLDENLLLLQPACESNKFKFEEVCRYIDQIKNKISNRLS